MRLSSLIVVPLLLSCASGPGSSGGTPTLRPEDFVEITYAHAMCETIPCAVEVTTIHRLGGAHRVYYTGGDHDSTRLSSIDSATFHAAAAQLIRIGAVKKGEWRTSSVGAFSVDNWTISVVTTSGRYGSLYTAPSREYPPFKEKWQRELNDILSPLRWHVPVE